MRDTFREYTNGKLETLSDFTRGFTTEQLFTTIGPSTKTYLNYVKRLYHGKDLSACMGGLIGLGVDASILSGAIRGYKPAQVAICLKTAIFSASVINALEKKIRKRSEL